MVLLAAFPIAGLGCSTRPSFGGIMYAPGPGELFCLCVDIDLEEVLKPQAGELVRFKFLLACR